MKKLFLLFLSLVAAFSANASIEVCEYNLYKSGQVNSQYIKSGTVTWSKENKTLTLDNAVIEYYTDNIYDNIRPIRITEDEATIVIHGECKLITNGFVAIAFDSYNTKQVTIMGDGSLYTSSSWLDLFIKATQLTIKDINLTVNNGIGDNGNGVWVALTFDNVQASIKGWVERIGEGITFKNSAITYPADAYIGEIDGYGYAIFCGNDDYPDHIVISRSSKVKGDVNNDGEVNIADVNAVIDVILGSGNNASADVNKDGEINIADINAIIDLILGGGAPQDNHEYVDLGLPSGTLWATCNIGANTPEQYGDYFAWGETAPKQVYTWETYKWCKGSDNSITKYCMDSSFGTVDGKTELEPEDDAAYVNWGASWRIPSQDQTKELCDKCSWQWTQRNGVNGMLVIGVNGNTIFLPAAGFRMYNNVSFAGSRGNYLSRSLAYSNCDYYLYLESGLWIYNYYGDRFVGQTIRPVRVTQN